VKAQSEVVRDRVRTAVVAGDVQIATQLDAGVLHVLRHSVCTGLGAPRARLEARLTALPIPGDQLGDPYLRDAGTPSHLRMTPAVADDRLDDAVLHAHGPLPLAGTMS
jgi:hypothetical protein